MSGKTQLPPAPLPIGPAVSQSDAEECSGAVPQAFNMEAVEVLPPEALACVSVPGIAPATAVQLKAEFRLAFGDAHLVLADAATVSVTDVSQVEEMARAKALRLRLKASRCAIENVRKDQKADSLMRGKAIDGVANALKAAIEPAEAWLLEQEQFAQRVEAKRIDDLRAERRAALAPFLDPAASASSIDLAYLTPAEWDAMLEGAKMQAQVRAETERTEAEARRLAEEARKAKEIEDEAERKRLAEENERLRKAQAEKDAAALAERKAAEAKQAAVDAENRRLREEAEKAKKEEADRLYKAECERIDKERAERVEAARLAEIERKAASAPDKEKALAFAACLRALALPEMSTDKGRELCAMMKMTMGEVADIIESNANTML